MLLRKKMYLGAGDTLILNYILLVTFLLFSVLLERKKRYITPHNVWNYRDEWGVLWKTTEILNVNVNLMFHMPLYY